MHLTTTQARAHADAVRETSVTILKGAIPAETVEAMKLAFGPLLAAAVRRGGAANRGLHRYYLDLPFQGPWADPALVDNDAIMAVVEALVGADGALCQLGLEAALLGSEQDSLRRDTDLLFPETTTATPPYQLAVEIPLVDITDDTGFLEYAPGTHLLPRAEALRRIEAGEVPLVRPALRRGDVMIRDVRHLHRAGPNRLAHPRPTIVAGYVRGWLHRRDVSIRVPADVLVSLSERARRWLRFNPVFPTRAEAACHPINRRAPTY